MPQRLTPRPPIPQRINPRCCAGLFFEHASAAALVPNCTRKLDSLAAQSQGQSTRKANAALIGEDPMRKTAPIIMMVLLGALATAAQAVDRGQFENVPDNIRSWFKAVVSPSGVPCCDI